MFDLGPAAAQTLIVISGIEDDAIDDHDGDGGHLRLQLVLFS